MELREFLLRIEIRDEQIDLFKNPVRWIFHPLQFWHGIRHLLEYPSLMRFLCPFFFSVILLLTGCGEAPPSQKPAAPAPRSAVTAPVDYIATSIQTGENSRGKIEMIAVQKAIESYQQQEGHNPESLEELHQKQYLPSLPRPPAGHEFKYDAATGIFSIVPLTKPSGTAE